MRAMSKVDRKGKSACHEEEVLKTKFEIMSSALPQLQPLLLGA